MRGGSWLSKVEKELTGGYHALLIVGWRLTPYGEAWIIHPLMDYDGDTVAKPDIGVGENVHSSCSSSTSAIGTSNMIHIGFGQFGINERCLAPNTSLNHISWQPGPYFDSDFREAPKWREWDEMELPITETELKSLAMCMKN